MKNEQIKNILNNEQNLSISLSEFSDTREIYIFFEKEYIGKKILSGININFQVDMEYLLEKISIYFNKEDFNYIFPVNILFLLIINNRLDLIDNKNFINEDIINRLEYLGIPDNISEQYFENVKSFFEILYKKNKAIRKKQKIFKAYVSFLKNSNEPKSKKILKDFIDQHSYAELLDFAKKEGDNQTFFLENLIKLKLQKKFGSLDPIEDKELLIEKIQNTKEKILTELEFQLLVERFDFVSFKEVFSQLIINTFENEEEKKLQKDYFIFINNFYELNQYNFKYFARNENFSRNIINFFFKEYTSSFNFTSKLQYYSLNKSKNVSFSKKRNYFNIEYFLNNFSNEKEFNEVLKNILIENNFIEENFELYAKLVFELFENNKEKALELLINKISEQKNLKINYEILNIVFYKIFTDNSLNISNELKLKAINEFYQALSNNEEKLYIGDFEKLEIEIAPFISENFSFKDSIKMKNMISQKIHTSDELFTTKERFILFSEGKEKTLQEYTKYYLTRGKGKVSIYSIIDLDNAIEIINYNKDTFIQLIEDLSERGYIKFDVNDVNTVQKFIKIIEKENITPFIKEKIYYELDSSFKDILVKCIKNNDFKDIDLSVFFKDLPYSFEEYNTLSEDYKIADIFKYIIEENKLDKLYVKREFVSSLKNKIGLFYPELNKVFSNLNEYNKKLEFFSLGSNILPTEYIEDIKEKQLNELIKGLNIEDFYKIKFFSLLNTFFSEEEIFEIVKEKINLNISKINLNNSSFNHLDSKEPFYIFSIIFNNLNYKQSLKIIENISKDTINEYSDIYKLFKNIFKKFENNEQLQLKFKLLTTFIQYDKVIDSNIELFLNELFDEYQKTQEILPEYFLSYQDEAYQKVLKKRIVFYNLKFSSKREENLKEEIKLEALNNLKDSYPASYFTQKFTREIEKLYMSGYFSMEEIIDFMELNKNGFEQLFENVFVQNSWYSIFSSINLKTKDILLLSSLSKEKKLFTQLKSEGFEQSQQHILYSSKPLEDWNEKLKIKYNIKINDWTHDTHPDYWNNFEQINSRQTPLNIALWRSTDTYATFSPHSNLSQATFSVNSKNIGEKSDYRFINQINNAVKDYFGFNSTDITKNKYRIISNIHIYKTSASDEDFDNELFDFEDYKILLESLLNVLNRLEKEQTTDIIFLIEDFLPPSFKKKMENKNFSSKTFSQLESLKLDFNEDDTKKLDKAKNVLNDFSNHNHNLLFQKINITTLKLLIEEDINNISKYILIKNNQDVQKEIFEYLYSHISKQKDKSILFLEGNEEKEQNIDLFITKFEEYFIQKYNEDNFAEQDIIIISNSLNFIKKEGRKLSENFESKFEDFIMNKLLSITSTEVYISKIINFYLLNKKDLFDFEDIYRKIEDFDLNYFSDTNFLSGLKNRSINEKYINIKTYIDKKTFLTQFNETKSNEKINEVLQNALYKEKSLDNIKNIFLYIAQSFNVHEEYLTNYGFFYSFIKEIKLSEKNIKDLVHLALKKENINKEDIYILYNFFDSIFETSKNNEFDFKNIFFKEFSNIYNQYKKEKNIKKTEVLYDFLISKSEYKKDMDIDIDFDFFKKYKFFKLANAIEDKVSTLKYKENYDNDEKDIIVSNEYKRKTYVDYLDFSFFEDFPFVSFIEKDDKVSKIFTELTTPTLLEKYGAKNMEEVDSLNKNIENLLKKKKKYLQLKEDFNKTKSQKKKEKIELELDTFDFESLEKDIKLYESKFNKIWKSWYKDINIKLVIFNICVFSKKVNSFKNGMDKGNILPNFLTEENFDFDLYERFLDILNKNYTEITEEDFYLLYSHYPNDNFIISLTHGQDISNKFLASNILNGDYEKKFSMLKSFDYNKYLKVKNKALKLFNVEYDKLNNAEQEVFENILYISNFDLNNIKVFSDFSNEFNFSLDEFHFLNLELVKDVGIREYFKYTRKIIPYLENDAEDIIDIKQLMNNIDYVKEQLEGKLSYNGSILYNLAKMKLNNFDLQNKNMEFTLLNSITNAAENNVQLSISKTAENALDNIDDNLNSFQLDLKTFDSADEKKRNKIEEENKKINKDINNNKIYSFDNFFFMKRLYKTKDDQWAIQEDISPFDLRTYAQGYATHSCLTPDGVAKEILKDMSVSPQNWETLLISIQKNNFKEDNLEKLQQMIEEFNNKLLEGFFDIELEKEITKMIQKYFYMTAASATWKKDFQRTNDNMEYYQKTYITDKNGNTIRINESKDYIVEAINVSAENNALFSELQILNSIKTKLIQGENNILDKLDFSPLYTTIGSGYSDIDLDTFNKPANRKNFVEISHVYTDAKISQQYLVHSHPKMDLGNKTKTIEYFQGFIGDISENTEDKIIKIDNRIAQLNEKIKYNLTYKNKLGSTKKIKSSKKNTIN